MVNVCSELDWKRCVAVHLWFMLPPTASVADALTKYEAAFQVSCCLSLSRYLHSRFFPSIFFSCSPLIVIVVVCVSQGSCEGGKYACAPLPPYLEGGQPNMEDEEEEEEESKRPLHDLCFHLLKLYSDRSTILII